MSTEASRGGTGQPGGGSGAPGSQEGSRGGASRGSRSEEFSAGGLVIRNAEVLVIVPTRRAADGRRVLALPKGHPDPGESALEAATREVREETGVNADPVEKLGDVSYWYQRKGRRRHKVVAFFLFAFRDGSVEDHDDEVEEARWLPLARAAEELTYEGERGMAQLAMARMLDHADDAENGSGPPGRND